MGCKSAGEVETMPKMVYEDTGSGQMAGIRGRITDPETGEGLIGAHVILMQNETFIAGVSTDFDGNFLLNVEKPGMYDLQIKYIGYEPMLLENLPVEAGKVLFIEESLEIQESQIIELKPMIYLYPEEEMEVNISLNYNGKLTHTYPKSNGNWEVTAKPDGTLTDENQRNYYGLFWEGIPNKTIQPDCGTVVAKDSLIPFLETSLDQLGLNFKESNEFIVFWLSILEQNPYNLIYFASDDYTEHAALNIEPKPDNVIRVMMGYVPLKSPVDIQSQTLPEKPSRVGFTVVEWGGTKCKMPNL